MVIAPDVTQQEATLRQVPLRPAAPHPSATEADTLLVQVGVALFYGVPFGVSGLNLYHVIAVLLR